MKIIIKNGSPVPIYEQIKNAIRDEILKENVKAGEKLPSVRALARELSISILTVKKAYDELEDEGFIESRQGLGTFVGKEDPNLRLEEKQKKLEESLLSAIRISKDIEMEKNDLFELLAYLYEGDFND
ncbi:GntR family transcriptional regulator [Anaerococcus sp. NML200537]|uniref:GntR family transcriptional regulator n=1 Tax=Anaerococcus sp. NML200537 TaxID=2954485 RepID=UPI002238DE1F|nr:GntR family transcriptional regulator [Anaerococcus sp. NML200537]MCW6700757.1 GntR family transcriptional regulator [Anaerococcus sp. NML200537]